LIFKKKKTGFLQEFSLYARLICFSLVLVDRIPLRILSLAIYEDTDNADIKHKGIFN
jgi:hypothetical protein